MGREKTGGSRAVKPFLSPSGGGCPSGGGGLNRPQERTAAEHTGNTKQKKETEVSLTAKKNSEKRNRPDCRVQSVNALPRAKT